MSATERRARLILSGLAIGAIVGSLFLGPASAAPVPPGGAAPVTPRPDVEAHERPQPEERRSYFVELDEQTTREAAAGARGDVEEIVSAAASSIEAAAEDVITASAGEATTLYATTNAVAGFVAELDATAAADISQSAGVVRILPIIPKKIQLNAVSDILTRAAEAWAGAAGTGEGTTIAIIDTGLDYTHSTFGDAALEYPTTAAALSAAVAWPQGKVVDGWDFVGLDYEPGVTPASPDPNPIDEVDPLCERPDEDFGLEGHGTHVAATAAGYGVSASGATFRGDYSSLTPDELLGFKVGPGSAPGADLIALKVFGCSDGTEYVAAALDWLMDPLRELPDVVNLSLGTVFGAPDDPDTAFVEAIAAAGAVVVAAAGNATDVFDIGGWPGSAESALAVAASVSGTFSLDAVGIRRPPGAPEERYLGTLGVLYSFADGASLPAQQAVTLTPGTLTYNSGCEPFTRADSATVAGKTVVLGWDDSAPLPCGSAVRFGNAAAAGATGVLLTGQAEAFEVGILGNDLIPGMQLTAGATADLVDYDPTTGVVTIPEPFEVRFAEEYRGAGYGTLPDRVDELVFWSSRGAHGSGGVVKPDVAAPGVGIRSAAAGTGSGAVDNSGTSMAAPHAAGIAALIAAAHPDWTAQELKAAVMNTASHDVTVGGVVAGPQLVGAGRVDALNATATQVIAYDSLTPRLVSSNFGLVEVGAASVSLTRAVTVQNLGGTTAVLEASFQPQSEIPGVTYSLSPSVVTVPAGGSATVDVTLSVPDPTALEKSLDPTMVEETIGFAREYLATATGWLELMGAPGVDGSLRVPVSAAVRPVSDLSASTVRIPAGGHSGDLTLTGRTLDSGGYVSLVTPTELVATSPRIPREELVNDSAAQADLAAVGVSRFTWTVGGTDYDYIGFALAGHAPWRTLAGSTSFAIDIDTGDPAGVYTVVVEKLFDGVDFYDVTIATVYAPDGTITGAEYVNGVAGDVDTASFDSAVAFLPVDLGALGFTHGQVTAGNVAFDYTVYGTSYYAPPAQPGAPERIVDVIDGLRYDDDDPHLTFGTGAEGVFTASGETTIPISASEPQAAPKILLLTPHNPLGAQSQIIDVTGTQAVASTTRLTIAPKSVRQDGPIPLTFTVRVSVADGTRASGNAVIRAGATVIAEVPIRNGVGVTYVSPSALTQGKLSMTASFESADPGVGGSTSRPVDVTVR